MMFALWASPPVGATERWADLADIVFQHYTQDNGLPHQIVTALAEDGDGFIWVGTQGGLARWDGYRFRSFLPDPADRRALPDNWVTVLHVDPQGRLWIGTSAGGLARYDRDHDNFTTYAAGPGGLSHAHIGAIADDGAGGLWIADDDGLDHLDPATGIITGLHHEIGNPGSLPEGAVQSVLRDRDGGLWVGTAKGLARRATGSEQFIAVPVAGSVWTLYQDDAGRIWLGLRGHGAAVLDRPDSVPRPVLETDSATSSVQSDSVYAIGAVGPGQIWLGTYGAGLVMVDTASGRTRRIRHDPIVPSSLAHDNIWAVLRDRAGSIWVGSVDGLDRRIGDQDAILTLFGAMGRKDGLTAPDVLSVLPTADGHVWVGFGSGGVDILDPVSAGVAFLPPDPTQPARALPKAVVYALQAADDQVYLGTSRGLYSAGLTDHAVARLSVPPLEPTALIPALLIDGDTLWIGSREDGIWHRPLSGGTALTPLDLALLTDRRVNTLLRGAGDDLWVGTLSGLNRVDLRSHAVEAIRADPYQPNALPAGVISSLIFDQQSRLWVGTLGGGIAILTGRDADGKAQFHRLGMAQGLPSGNVDKLLVDAKGRVWASTTDGLAIIDPISLAIRPLHRAEGVAIPHYWVGAGAPTQAGELLFGGAGGLTLVRPDRVRDWTYRPPVVVTDIRIGGKPVPSGRFNGLGSTQALIVAPEANSLAVEFAALDYTAPERNHYAYRLDGFDTGWVETDWSRRLAAYTNLPPGNYVLRLRGSNRDGAWTETALALPIQVLPSWYQTLWLKLAAGLVALGAVITLVQTRTAYLRRRQRALERLVAKRTADLEQRTGELGLSLAELRDTQAQLVQQEKLAALGQLTAGIAHEIQNPLNFINNFADLSTELVTELGEIAVAPGDDARELLDLLGQNLRIIASHGARAAGIVRGMLAHSRTGSGQTRATDLGSLLRNSLDEVIGSSPGREQAVGVQIEWQVDAPLPHPVIDPVDLAMVFANLLRNALYALDQRRQGREPDWRPALTLTARAAGEAVLVSIHDNGAGIPAAYQPKLFTPFFTTKPTGEGTGLGLSLSFDIIVKRYRGDLTIRSIEGEFTEARVLVPIGR